MISAWPLASFCSARSSLLYSPVKSLNVSTPRGSALGLSSLFMLFALPGRSHASLCPWLHPSANRRLLNPGSFTRVPTLSPSPDAHWTCLPVSYGTSNRLCPPQPCSLVPRVLTVSLVHTHTHSTCLCLSFSTPSAHSVSIHCTNHLHFIFKFLRLDPFLISDKDVPVQLSSFSFLC